MAELRRRGLGSPPRPRAGPWARIGDSCEARGRDPIPILSLAVSTVLPRSVTAVCGPSRRPVRPTECTPAAVPQSSPKTQHLVVSHRPGPPHLDCLQISGSKPVPGQWIRARPRHPHCRIPAALVAFSSAAIPPRRTRVLLYCAAQCAGTGGAWPTNGRSAGPFFPITHGLSTKLGASTRCSVRAQYRPCVGSCGRLTTESRLVWPSIWSAPWNGGLRPS